MTPPEGISDVDQTRRDEQRLAELGYKQELSRGWSSFTNFAISFTIISVLAGTFTTFSFAWLHGGPVMASIGWPVICFFVIMVGFSMAELTSRYPTAGGPYWWAHDLGGKGWSWMTGWFNIVGLLGIVASVAYGCAFFLFNLLQLYSVDIFGVNFGDTTHILSETFLLFLIILFLYTVVNIFADRILALMNNISVGWHLLGVAVIIALLVFVPDDHQSTSFVFGERLNESGTLGGDTGGLGLLVPGCAGRLPARDVHTDRLRRLRAHGRRDPRRRDQRRTGGLAFDLLVGDHRLARAPRLPLRGERRDRGERLGRRRVRNLQLGARPLGREDGGADRDRRSVLLRRGGPDQRVADLVRVLA